MTTTMTPDVRHRTALRRARRRRVAASLAAILVGCLSAGHGATVDIDYGQLRDLPFGKSLLAELKIDIPGAECDYAAPLARLRMDWDGTKSPLLISARGLPVAAMKLALAKATP